MIRIGPSRDRVSNPLFQPPQPHVRRTKPRSLATYISGPPSFRKTARTPSMASRKLQSRQSTVVVISEFHIRKKALGCADDKLSAQKGENLGGAKPFAASPALTKFGAPAVTTWANRLNLPGPCLIRWLQEPGK